MLCYAMLCTSVKSSFWTVFMFMFICIDSEARMVERLSRMDAAESDSRHVMSTMGACYEPGSSFREGGEGEGMIYCDIE